MTDIIQNQIYFIVDDDLDDIDFFCEIINEIDKGALCYKAHNGEEALKELCRKNGIRPNYIFLDLNMPRMDGKTCLTELKKNRSLKNIPVIIFTTSNHPKEKSEMMARGASYFLSKATSFKTLKEGILKALQACCYKSGQSSQ